MPISSFEMAAKTLDAGRVQTFAGATPIVSDFTNLYVWTGDDGILLPDASPGKTIWIRNTSGSAAKVYVGNLGFIEATAGATGISSHLVGSKTTIFACTGLVPGTSGSAPIWTKLGYLT